MINRHMYANEQGHKSNELNERVGKILGYENEYKLIRDKTNK